MTKIYSCVLILLPELKPRHFLGRQSLMKKNQLNKNLTVDVYKDPLRKYVIRKTQFLPPPPPIAHLLPPPIPSQPSLTHHWPFSLWGECGVEICHNGKLLSTRGWVF